MGKKNSQKRRVAYLWLLLNTVVWGAAFIAVKPALSFITPTRFLFYRYFWASLLSLPIFYYYRRQLKNVGAQLWRIILIESLGTIVVLWLLYYALNLISAIEASLLGNATPIFVTLGGIFFLKEKESRQEWSGLFLALIGTFILVIAPNLAAGQGFNLTSLSGNLIFLLAMLFNAAYYLLAKKYYWQLPLFLVTAISFYVGLIGFGLLFWQESSSLANIWPQIRLDWQIPATAIASLYMAFFGSIIGLTAYYQGQKHIEASEASLFTYLQPLVAIPLAIFFLSESVSWQQLLGLAIIFLGVIWGEKHHQ